MYKISLKSPAKINLSLDVIGLNNNGYHLLNMIVQTIDLFDFINISKTNSKKIKIFNKGFDIPLDQSNIIYKAAVNFFKYTNITYNGINIHIIKNIPTQAGLGGGSSNGATTLIGLNQLFHSKLSITQLQSIGLSLGADVPLFFKRGTLLCEGIGEIITTLPNLSKIYFVIVKPNIGFSTAKVYKQLDKINIKKHPNTKKIIEGIKTSDIQKICNNTYNVLEEAITNHEIKHIKKLLINHGALTSHMTGSGAAVFGIFNDQNKAICSVKMLKSLYTNVFLSTPLSY